MRQSKVVSSFHNKTGYLIYRLLNGKFVSASRYIWQQHNGKIPVGYEVDHMDSDITNNLIENFQLLLKQDNLSKRRYSD